MSQNQSAARTRHTRKARLIAAGRRLALAAPVAAGLALAAAVIPAGLASARQPCMDCEAPAHYVTATTVSSSANPSGFRQLVTYTATVDYLQGEPGGGITLQPVPGFGTGGFTDDGTPIAGCTAVPVSGGGTATCQAFLSLGTHTVAASYSGAAPYGSGGYTFDGSTGSMTQTVIW